MFFTEDLGSKCAFYAKFSTVQERILFFNTSSLSLYKNSLKLCLGVLHLFRKGLQSKNRGKERIFLFIFFPLYWDVNHSFPVEMKVKVLLTPVFQSIESVEQVIT